MQETANRLQYFDELMKIIVLLQVTTRKLLLQKGVEKHKGKNEAGETISFSLTGLKLEIA